MTKNHTPRAPPQLFIETKQSLDRKSSFEDIVAPPLPSFPSIASSNPRPEKNKQIPKTTTALNS